MNLHVFQSAPRFLVLFLAFTVSGTALAQPAFQVADVNPSLARSTGGVKPLPVSLGTRLFFEADDGIHGAELWVLETVSGTLSLVKDICPGLCSSSVQGLTPSNGLLFFFVQDGIHGFEPWKSDGTAEGTSMLADLNPGRASSLPSLSWARPGSLDVSGTLFFVANDGVNGEELWTLDGTGVRLVADIVPGAQSSFPELWLALGHRAVFSASDPAHGRDLWVSDGTEAGTVRFTDPGGPLFIESVSVADPASFLPLPDGTFLFRAEGQGSGVELWRSDGTEAGTALVKDIVPGGVSSSPWGFTAFAGRIYFGIGSPYEWTELWTTDGTEAGTVPVKALGTGSWSRTSWARAVGARLVFETGGRLWSSDGTAAGTFVVRYQNSRPGIPVNGALLFLPELFYDDDPLELWRTDGTAAGTALIYELGLQTPSVFLANSPVAVGGQAYFYASPRETGQAFWKSDGTASGTVAVQQSAQTPSLTRINGDVFAPVDGGLVFSAAAETPEVRIWFTDGSPEGTAPVSDSIPSGIWGDGFVFWTLLEDVALFSPPRAMSLWRTDGTATGSEEIVPFGLCSSWPWRTPASDVLFFGRTESPTDMNHELWRTDRTVAGTFKVQEIVFGEVGSHPIDLGKVAGATLLSVSGYSGAELWRTDGTPYGTVQVRDIEPGWESSFPHSLASLGSFGLFVASTKASGEELWRSDATPDGTFQLADIRPGAESSSPQGMIQVGSRVFFIADDGLHGRELWVSDGTAAGTRMVEDVRSGSLSSEIEELVRVRGRVFFVADDGIHGRELWGSDGTAAGTRLIKNIVPGPDAMPITELAAVGHVLLFAAWDDAHGVEPWVSDGTWDGTHRLQDIAPGPLPSSPARFTKSFPNVYFVANDGTTGFEPWALPRTALGSTFQDVPISHPAWREIERLAESGITLGCDTQSYCPDAPVLREQMAAFLERALGGDGFAPPPATGAVFADVPATSWAAPWIEQLATDALTRGCSAVPPLYCPAQPLTRAEMAVFLLRAKHGGSYTPPPATGVLFTDVSAGHWAASWIEQLAVEEITAGCAPGLYCPGDPVTRAQMALFLTRTFNLPLP